MRSNNSGKIKACWAQVLFRPACQTTVFASYADAQGHAVKQTAQSCKHPPLQASIPPGCPEGHALLCTAHVDAR